MKKESQRYLKSITLNTEHFLANLLALTKILGFTLAEAKPICRMKAGDKLEFCPYVLIKSRIAKAKSMREKQEMLKYKILDIKAMNEDGTISNEKMEKAIAHYQNEIDTLEYKIIKIIEN